MFDVKVDDIINEAINNPDVEYLEKKEDNVSAIIINLPLHVKERKNPKIRIKSYAQKVAEDWYNFELSYQKNKH